MLCKYRHIFGKERQGFHSYRLFDVAIGDLILTIILAWYISYQFNVSFWITLTSVLIIGIAIHRMFCVNSKINMLIFGQV